MSTAPALPTDHSDPFENALAYLGWVRVQHGQYLHEDGSVIECRVGYRRGTNVEVRYFVLNDDRVSLSLPDLMNYHRVGG